MDLLNAPEKLLVLLFLVATMLGIGLRAGAASLSSLFTSRSFLVRALAANFVVVPLLGLAIALFWPLAPGCVGAIVLLACVPGGLGSVQFTSRIKGEEALPGAVLVLLNVSALLLSPWILRVVLPPGMALIVPYGAAFWFLVVSILLPLGVGILLHDKAPRVAPAMSKAFAIVGGVAFIAFMLVARSFRKEAVASIGVPAVGAMALLIAGSMVIGWIMGGPGRGTRQLLATATSMRNAALCLAVAYNTPTGDTVMTPLIAFSMLMVPPNLLFTLYGTIRSRRSADRIGEAGKDIAA